MKITPAHPWVGPIPTTKMEWKYLYYNWKELVHNEQVWERSTTPGSIKQSQLSALLLVPDLCKDIPIFFFKDKHLLFWAPSYLTKTIPLRERAVKSRVIHQKPSVPRKSLHLIISGFFGKVWISWAMMRVAIYKVIFCLGSSGLWL